MSHKDTKILAKSLKKYRWKNSFSIRLSSTVWLLTKNQTPSRIFSSTLLQLPKLLFCRARFWWILLYQLYKRKRAIRSKSDLWTIDGFQTKPLWKLEILQKLLLLKVFSPKLLKHTITFFVTVLFNMFTRETLTDDFRGLHKNMNCVFPLNKQLLTRNWLSWNLKENNS